MRPISSNSLPSTSASTSASTTPPGTPHPPSPVHQQAPQGPLADLPGPRAGNGHGGDRFINRARSALREYGPRVATVGSGVAGLALISLGANARAQVAQMPNPSRWDEARSILEVGSGAALVVACMASLYFMRSPQELREIEMGQRRDVVRAAMDIAMGIDESVDMEGEIGANMVRVVDHLQDYYDVRINPNPDPNATVTRTCGQSVVSAIEGSMASPQQMVRNLLDLINRGIVSDRHTSRLPESNHTASSSAQQANPGDHPGIHGQDTPPHIALTIEDYESDPQEEAFFDAVQVIEEGPRPRE